MIAVSPSSAGVTHILLQDGAMSAFAGPGFMDWQKTEFLRERMNKDRQE